uniref:Uncharacterized protein n=1 Tax=Arundo donax TaxID=35708 RepID=A0A0A8ZGS7_ARUDO
MELKGSQVPLRITLWMMIATRTGLSDAHVHGHHIYVAVFPQERGKCRIDADLEGGRDHLGCIKSAFLGWYRDVVALED